MGGCIGRSDNGHGRGGSILGTGCAVQGTAEPRETLCGGSRQHRLSWAVREPHKYHLCPSASVESPHSLPPHLMFSQTACGKWFLIYDSNPYLAKCIEPACAECGHLKSLHGPSVGRKGQYAQYGSIKTI